MMLVKEDPGTRQALRLFSKETLRQGQPVQIACVDIGGQTYQISRGLMTAVTLEDERYEDVRDPAAVLDVLRSSRRDLNADMFSFWQRLPHTEPRHPYYYEWESIAALPVTTFDDWWKTQIKGNTRNMIRKSQKAGVEIRDCSYDEPFVRGMTTLFNETRVRQGRPFWHYGKDLQTVRAQFSRYIFREDLVGAFLRDELVGFAMVGNAGTYGDLVQIIGSVSHRDKAIPNALIANAVQKCERRGLPYLVYASWDEGSLSEFKRHSGFREVRLPRYFVPLTAKGEWALKAGLHRPINTLVPRPLKMRLKAARDWWYRRHCA